MLDWPQPTSVSALRGFLGLIGYYRRFVKDYAKLAGPLTNLLKKDSFTWTEDAFSAFVILKQAMTTLPVLALLNFTQTFDVETDASGSVVGPLTNLLKKDSFTWTEDAFSAFVILKQ
nr:putative mitochondrial protein [Tanacetum cinerariifolium]